MHLLSGDLAGHAASYVLAILAAITNAVGQILQRKASRKEPEKLQMSAKLFTDLAQRPVWLLGIGAVVLGSIFQIAALGFGTLATVQTLVILELPLTLIGARFFLNSDLRLRDWISIAVMTAGTAGVVGFLSPRGGNAAHIAALTWLIAGVATLIPLVVLYLLARRSEGAREAALLGAATGICFALFAAFVKGVTLQFQHEGIAAVVTSWEIYVAALAAAVSMWLLQNALHAGRLAAAQPGMTLLDPAVSIVWGVLVFNEQVRGGLYIVLAIISAAAITAGAIALGESLEGDSEEAE